VANPEHLAKVKEGVAAWNGWRRASPGTLPDLSGVNLSGANLEGFILVGTDLRGSDLSAANLRGVDVSGANVGGTIFQNVDLSSVTGLDVVNHFGRSAVSISTLYRSHGRIPDSFLRGCRVPDDYISYMRSLVANPVDVCAFFISYSTKNEAFAEGLHDELEKKAVRCWFAPDDLKIGDRFQERIEESILRCEKLLVVLSTDSVNSPWVQREVQAGVEKELRQNTTVLFPVRLDDAIMDCPHAWASDIRRTRHIGDFRKWKDHDSFQKSLDRLLRDLKGQRL
jgi:TIR domain/Pentapeptide repeats (8 copies)